MDLNGLGALVTGGAKRVGRAIVTELARAGCNVAIHYHRSSLEAESLKKQLASPDRKVELVVGDLNHPASWPAIIDRTVSLLGRLDILINNAAIFPSDPPDTLEGFDPVQWDRILRTNLIAPMGLCHHARRHLVADGGGCIVNLCDIAANRPWTDHLGYSASKAALASMTQGLARALAPGVRVNGVAPGIAVFPEHYTDEFRQELIQKVPLNRAGSPEEVAKLVRFLVESGDYVTGQVIPLDGGRSLI